MKNPSYWWKLHFSGQIFAKIRQKKTLMLSIGLKKHVGDIPKIRVLERGDS